jgi:hypothetical protein
MIVILPNTLASLAFADIEVHDLAVHDPVLNRLLEPQIATLWFSRGGSAALYEGGLR